MKLVFQTLNPLDTNNLSTIKYKHIYQYVSDTLLDKYSVWHYKKMKLFVKDFFRKCDLIRRKLRIWSHLLKKSLMENFVFCTESIVKRGVDIWSNFLRHFKELVDEKSLE